MLSKTQIHLMRQSSLLMAGSLVNLQERTIHAGAFRIDTQYPGLLSCLGRPCRQMPSVDKGVSGESKTTVSMQTVSV